MKPLKAEVEALAEVLHTPLADFITEREANEHKDPQTLAQTRMFTKAIEAVDEARAARGYVYLVFQFGEANGWLHGFGPFSTEAQAQTAAAAIIAVRDYSTFAIIPTHNWQAFVEQEKQLDAPPATKGQGQFALVAEDARLFKIGWNGNQRTRTEYLRKLGSDVH